MQRHRRGFALVIVIIYFVLWFLTLVVYFFRHRPHRPHRAEAGVPCMIERVPAFPEFVNTPQAEAARSFGAE